MPSSSSRLAGTALLMAIQACTPNVQPHSSGEPIERGEGVDVAFIPPFVEQVETLGEWVEGTRFGYYRVIVSKGGFDHVGTKVHVEWMARSATNAAPDVIVSQEIDALDDLGPASFGEPSYRSELNQLQIELPFFNPYSEQNGRISIRAGLPGKLRVTVEED